MAVSSPVDVSVDAASPNVFWIERDAQIALYGVDSNTYELRKGRCLLGVVAFYDSKTQWGWRFFPCQTGKRPSRVLYPLPEDAVKGRFAIQAIYTSAKIFHKALR